MADDKYYRITKDEALINAYAAFANTNNPDDQVKIKNLYNSFKEGKISKSEFDKGINYYIQSNGFDYTAGHSINRDELRYAADHKDAKPILNGKVQNAPASVPARLISDIIGNFIPGGSSLLERIRHSANDTYAPEESFANIGDNPYDSSIKLNNNVQHVINTLKTYGYPQQAIDSFQQDINKILANTKDNNRIDTANQYIDQFLGNKKDLRRLEGLRRLEPVPGKPAPNQQPQSGAPAPAPAPADNKDEVAKLASGVADSIENLVKADKAQGKSEIPNSSEVSAANAAKAQAEAVVKAKADAAALASAGNKNKSGKKPGMSDAEIDAFLKGELGTTGWSSDKGLMRKGDNGTLASAGVAKGGTKTIGFDDPYDPNPGNVSLAYTLRNAPEQERRTALINAWNKEHGISYVTGKDGVIYRIDPQHPNGIVDPFKNDLSTWTRATRSGSTYATPGINTGGMYATGEGIKDANGNVLTNPGGDWEYQYALRDPQYGLGMMSKMSDAQKKYLQAVADDMGYKYNFTGAPRYV